MATLLLKGKAVSDAILLSLVPRVKALQKDGIIPKLAAKFLDRFEWFPVTRDQLTMLLEGNTVEKQYFSDFDIKPIKFERKNLSYLM